MGTGGGEVLLEIDHPHENTYATEAYLPNFAFCQQQLSSLGITVKQIFEDDKLPFEDETFDFVINRHEFFDFHSKVQTTAFRRSAFSLTLYRKSPMISVRGDGNGRLQARKPYSV